jgi:hypothetical protein
MTDQQSPERRGVYVIIGLLVLIGLGFALIIWLRTQTPDEPPQMPPPPPGVEIDG